MMAFHPKVKILLWLVVLFLFGVGLVVSGFKLFAPQHAATGPGIRIVRAELSEQEHGWDLDAHVDIELTPEIRRGLYSGVPLEFVIELSITEPGPYLWHKTVASQGMQYTLIYYELTRHYRLVDVGTGSSRNFRSLLAALDELGNVRSLPIFGEPVGAESQLAHLRVRLDTGALPLPLQSLWSSNWHLVSQERTWPIY